MQETKIRESNFELCRLFAIFSVLMYHGISYYIMKYNPENMYGHALWLPFRTAVSLFVLISGYFGIKATIMGGAKLISKTLIYFVPLQVFGVIHAQGNLHDLILSFLPISNGPYWFITTYLCLYMLAPFINEFLSGISDVKRVQLIIILSIMSLYLGFVGPVDGPLALGKNVVHFVLLYIIGNTIRYKKDCIDKMSTKTIVLFYLLIGILPVFFFCCVAHTKITYLMCLFDWDNGLFLFLSAILLFLLFSRIKIKSRVINYLASSVFAVYILQQQPFVASFLENFFYGLCPIDILPIKDSLMGTLSLALFVFIRSILYMGIFILIDKTLTPIWNIVSKFSSYLDVKLKLLFYKLDRLWTVN